MRDQEYNTHCNSSCITVTMPAISLRLPDDLETKLAREAEMTGKPRSEVAREAIADYLARREQERLMAELTAAARTLAVNPKARRETRAMADTAVDDGLDPLTDFEQPAGPDDPWWQ